MSSAGQWLHAPHLTRAEGGAAALAAFRRMPEAEQHDVVEFGDALAESSLALAQAYALQAPYARSRLDRDDFVAWARQALDLGTGTRGHRDVAMAFLKQDAVALASCDRRLLARWRDLIAEVHAASRKLAVLFLEGTAPVLRRLRAGGRKRLEAWVEGGLELAASTGWRGEFLAAAYFEAGAAVLPILSATEIRRWATLGAAVQVGRELEQRYFRGLPDDFASLSGTHRSAVFSLCEAAAKRTPRTAARLFEALPEIVARFEARLRSALLEALAAADDAEAVLALLPLLEPIVHEIPRADRLRLLERAATTGQGLPHCVVPLLRSLPRALELAGARALPRWIDRGEALGGVNPEAARAFFALESRTALHVLREGSASVHLEEVEGVLRSYVRMLSASALTIRAGEGASLRAFLDPESLEGTSIALPPIVDVFPSWEDNFSILKLAAAGGVGRLLFGTYELSLARVRERLPRPLAHALAATASGDTLADLLESLTETDPLVMLFTACEGVRIDFRLRRRYRGYAAEIGRIAAVLAWAVPRGRRSVDLILYLLGAGLSAAAIASRDLPVDLLAVVSSSLSSPAATVEDALAVAIQVHHRLGPSVAISGYDPPVSYEELLFEKIASESALLEEREVARERDEAARPTEILDLDPAAVEEDQEEGGGTSLSPEELKRLLEAGAILKIGRSGEGMDSAGIFARDLPFFPSREEGAAVKDEEASIEAPRRGRRGSSDTRGFEYDEWDYTIRDYRARWCRLEEIALAGDAGEFFHDTLSRYGHVLPEVRRQFQRLRPERYRKVRGLEDGEDFDLNAAVDARVELRARRSPSQRLYVARRAEERDVATLFLVDMSASTDEPLPAANTTPERPARGAKPRRIIDVTKEALVIMAEALEELGDRYAIYGFSGQGRENVEFYVVKRFQEGLNPHVRGAIGGIEPRRSTRMGTALRHARAKMANLTSRSKHIFLLSDGFPQDFDYGNDRRSNTYGIQDTMMALQECQASGITPFCITVDKAGHDYLREMCETSRYLVIDDVAALPSELPKIYERWVRA